MPRTDTRKCTKCKKTIEFDLDNISGIVRYNNFFYHSDCFVEYCQGRAAESSSPVWQRYIDDMSKFENAAKEKINYKKNKDDFNCYLLNHYDVAAVPDRFWTVIAELENGKYKNKKCNPVPIKTLFDAWKWGQVKLDGVNRRNKASNNGPKNDVERIPYDLAILVKHIPDYIKYKAKCDAEEAERIAKEKEKIKIDYSKINSCIVKAEGLDDISDPSYDF